MSGFPIESHSLRTPEERRKARVCKGGKNKNKWDITDKIVGLVYVDLINGLSTSDVVEKFAECAYEGQDKPIKKRTAQDYIRAARRRLELDFQYEADELRHDLYAKMLAVYADAVEHNDRYNALIALDKIMKLTGCALDKQQNNIQLNATSSGVTINFGFNKNEEETNEEVSDNRQCKCNNI